MMDVQVASAPSATAPDGGPTDLFPSMRYLLSALRHRWRVWVIPAVIGVVATVAVFFAFPPPYSATTTMFLVHPRHSVPLRALENDVELLKTRTVAQRVVRDLGLDVTDRELLNSYRVELRSERILRLTVEAGSASEAVRRARGVATAFLAFRAEEVTRQAQAQVDALKERSDAVAAELRSVNEKITGLSTANALPNDSSVLGLGDLLGRRSTLTEQGRQLIEQTDTVLLEAHTIETQSRVLDPASEDQRAALRPLATNGVAALAGGLLLGAGWVVVTALTSDRVWRPVDVARALGVPVAVGTGPLPRPGRRQRRAFRRHLGTTDPRLGSAVRQLRLSLPDDGRPAPVVISHDADGPAALIVASLAVELVEEGANMLLLDLSNRGTLFRILDAPLGKPSVVYSGSQGTKLRITSSDPDDDGVERARSKGDVVLAMATLDPAEGAFHLAPLSDTAVVVVGTRRSTFSSLQSTSNMLRAAGLTCRHAIVVGADRRGDTVEVLSGMRATLHEEPAHIVPTAEANAQLEAVAQELAAAQERRVAAEAEAAEITAEARRELAQLQQEIHAARADLDEVAVARAGLDGEATPDAETTLALEAARRELELANQLAASAAREAEDARRQAGHELQMIHHELVTTRAQLDASRISRQTIEREAAEAQSRLTAELEATRSQVDTVQRELETTRRLLAAEAEAATRLRQAPPAPLVALDERFVKSEQELLELRAVAEREAARIKELAQLEYGTAKALRAKAERDYLSARQNAADDASPTRTNEAQAAIQSELDAVHRRLAEARRELQAVTDRRASAELEAAQIRETALHQLDVAQRDVEAARKVRATAEREASELRSIAELEATQIQEQAHRRLQSAQHDLAAAERELEEATQIRVKIEREAFGLRAAATEESDRLREEARRTLEAAQADFAGAQRELEEATEIRVSAQRALARYEEAALDTAKIHEQVWNDLDTAGSRGGSLPRLERVRRERPTDE